MNKAIPKIRNARRTAARAAVLTPLLYALLFQDAYAQVAPIPILEWFYDRLLWTMIISGITGLGAVLFVFRRIKYEPEEITLDRKVRRAFLLTAGLTLFGLAIFLLIDVSMIRDFGIELTFAEAVSQVWLGWETVIILAFAALTFYVVAVLFTRVFGRAFPSGRYALWPWPKPDSNQTDSQQGLPWR